jgi:type VI secretion system protein VasG
VGAGGQAGTGDAANLLKPALARGALRTIGATTWSEYKRHIEKDPALTRRFQVLQVMEPEKPTRRRWFAGWSRRSKRITRSKYATKPFVPPSGSRTATSLRGNCRTKPSACSIPRAREVALSLHATPACVASLRQRLDAAQARPGY